MILTRLSIIIVLLAHSFSSGGPLAIYSGSNLSQSQVLEKYLLKYKKIGKKGGWQTIPGGKSIYPGKCDSRITKIRKRLILTGELEEVQTNKGDTFDIALVKAIRKFQQCHNIDSIGIIGPKTLHELNVTIQERIRQIEINIERWKKFQIQSKKNYVLVNIASAKLHLIENDSLSLSMKVIVGKPKRETPEFDAKLTAIEFFPYWVVPPIILKEDLLPILRRNPAFIRKNNMHVYYRGIEVNPLGIRWKHVDPNHCPYTIIQDPGPENPMGIVKFWIPNSHYIYMHDTPFKTLFEISPPALSSGCVRLSEPMKLCYKLLSSDHHWIGEKVDSIIAAGQNLVVQIKDPYIIRLCYFTAWINQEGDLCFAPDIYGKDDTDQIP